MSDRLRTDHVKENRKNFESNSEGKRIGRSRQQWLKEVEKDLREMKVKEWGRRQHIELSSRL